MARISIIGGTGDLGAGLAARLCGKHEIIIGSRSREKAEKFAESYSEKLGCRIMGYENAKAASIGEYIVLAIPSEALEDILKTIVGVIKPGAKIVTPIVPMRFKKGVFEYAPIPYNGCYISAAEYIKARVPKSGIIAAFHTVPARLLASGKELSADIPVAADGLEEFDSFVNVFSIRGLRYLYCCRILQAAMIESLVPLLLNIGKNNGIRYPVLRVAEADRS